ncbi:MAG: rane protein, partial [Pseudomonas sp.]|nr:rane protein [Pseudomonas sp.]
VRKEVMAQPDQGKVKTPYLSSLLTTAAAGFGAAQGIADTALSAHASELAKNLKGGELKGVHVQMGKLHIGLGIIGYSAGLAAAALSLKSLHSKWLNAAREGNSAAQAGAVLSMMGNSGFMFSNAYGLGETVIAGKNVLAVALQPEKRLAAWATAGVRLSTVFFRVNVVGVLSTALELSGSWFYNRNDLSRHDRWLQTTPWSQFPKQRLWQTIEEFQKRLHTQVKAPKIEVLLSLKNDQGIQSRRVRLHFPMTSSDDLMNPLHSSAAKTMLKIGAYKVRTHTTKGRKVDRWSIVTDSLFDNIQIAQAFPLILELEVPADWSPPTATEQDDLVVTAMFGDLRPQDGNYELNVYHLRASLYGSTEQLADSHLEPQGGECNFILVKSLELSQKED